MVDEVRCRHFGTSVLPLHNYIRVLTLQMKLKKEKKLVVCGGLCLHFLHENGTRLFLVQWNWKVHHFVYKSRPLDYPLQI
jgi:hypothetical protein